jgi:hypothetical protein
MNRLTPLLAAVLALISGLVMLGSGELTADGTRVLALDDSYIHIQYGWQAAQGHFLEYNTGDAPSSGATSLLYMLVLAAGFAAGISHAAMPDAALIFGLILFPVGAALLADLTQRAAARCAPISMTRRRRSSRRGRPGCWLGRSSPGAAGWPGLTSAGWKPACC